MYASYWLLGLVSTYFRIRLLGFRVSCLNFEPCDEERRRLAGRRDNMDVEALLVNSFECIVVCSDLVRLDSPPI